MFLGILAGKNEGEEMRIKWWEHVFYYGHLLRISDDLRCLIPKNCTQTPHLEETCGKVPSYTTKGIHLEISLPLSIQSKSMPTQFLVLKIMFKLHLPCVFETAWFFHPFAVPTIFPYC